MVGAGKRPKHFLPKQVLETDALGLPFPGEPALALFQKNSARACSQSRLNFCV